jgi:hypothetical protein
MGHWALGIGHGALGMGHWALGIGHGALVINSSTPAPSSPHSCTDAIHRVSPN